MEKKTQEGYALKKLLIIQTDGNYFLLETLELLLEYHGEVANFELSVLADKKAYSSVKSTRYQKIKVIFDPGEASENKFDVSVNLSLNEFSWELHNRINSSRKIGFRQSPDGLKAPELWSSYLLTLKANAPFLTFSLQEIYKNILGIKKLNHPAKTRDFRTVAFGMASHSLFKPSEQEAFINGLARRYRHLKIKDISEITEAESPEVLYLGPATLEAMKLCYSGARGIFLASRFQGFNLLPNIHHTHLITTSGGEFKAAELLELTEKFFQEEAISKSLYGVYRLERDQLHYSYLNNITNSDANYPFYKSYVVLWNFLLSLLEVDLTLTPSSPEQQELIQGQQDVLSKLKRLHDYAMVSLNVILQEAKSNKANAENIDGHLKNLREIDQTFEKIAESHPLLRPLLDFYRIRKGQNEGNTLLEQVQSSLITYTEEHQALEAFNELLGKLKTKA